MKRSLNSFILQQNVKLDETKSRCQSRTILEHFGTVDEQHIATEFYRNIFGCEIPSQPAINLHLLYGQLDSVSLVNLSLPFS